MSSLPTTQQVALGAGASIALYWLWNYLNTWNRAPYPPGPVPLPLLGNILDMPTTLLPVGFADFGKKYGPLTFIQVPGSKILVINSYEAASDLLDKRGSLYADRPRMVMMGELVGVEGGTPLKHYGHGWKLQRKFLRQALSANAIRNNYAELLHRNWTQYLMGALNDPENLLTDLSRMLGKTVIEFAYGRDHDAEGNDYLERLRHVQQLIAKVTFGYVVDLAPFLKHLPSWLPGMKFKRDAAGWKAETDETRNLLFSQAIKDSDDSEADAQPSYTVNALNEFRASGQEVSETDDTMEAIKQSGFSFYAAGAETTDSTFRSFLLAMTLYPEVQAAAHAEIDRVIGRDRMPTFEDRSNTPYITALIQESLRWNPAGPIGVPHRLIEDDVYEGYFIPKGTTVFPSIWYAGISRNPKYYTDPSSFKPERFLEGAEPVLDPRQFVFGFGRRICPGNELAIQSVWIGMALTLWAFEIKPVGDDPALHSDLGRFTLDSVR
ncbi:hypothetical protein M407DRAFT_70131 [Tulasnella calospora MUT 4182]|uniref:Cytochrome P450 n=1 Tax=Tulasnella calospora MUT 4182 TaxID=1051891 RepID=A0A0C3M7H9_9AGAM|nr:hypothetical protein M407DRAFT_70131 [Tulasnella calospora MUT 4182]